MLIVTAIDRLEAYLEHLLGPPTFKEGVNWRYGSKGALSICVRGPKRGTFIDWSDEDANGGLIALTMHIRQCTRKAAIDYLRCFTDGELSPSPPRNGYVRASGRQRNTAERIAAAQDKWSKRRPLLGSKAAVNYLRFRGISSADLPDCVLHNLRDPDKIASTSGLRHRATGDEKLDAILVPLFNNADGRFTCLHLTLLHGDGRKIDRVSEYPDRRTYGVAFSPELGIVTNGYCLGGDNRRCAVAEGLENALSVASALEPDWTVWAALNRTTLRRWIPPSECREVIVMADPDSVRGPGKYSPGLSAANQARDHIVASRAIPCRIIVPPVTDEDYNAFHCRVGTKELRAYLRQR